MTPQTRSSGAISGARRRSGTTGMFHSGLLSDAWEVIEVEDTSLPRGLQL